MQPVNCLYFYRDGRHYDSRNNAFTEDIPFYLKWIKQTGMPALELACGTGRLTVPLAAQGVRMTGLDISEPMLRTAKEKASKRNVDVEWVYSDCRNFNIDKRFKIIIFPFNSIAHLEDEESVDLCFSCVKKHLHEFGRFIVDTFNIRMDYLTRNPKVRYPLVQYPDPDGRGMVTISESTSYDAATQICRVKWYITIENIPGEETEEYNYRVFHPRELDALLRHGGFNIEYKYGNYDETAFSAISPRQILICNVHK
ncbi:MAG: dTDP-3-amino-3,4,6-trideoxy-alpha-D-glucopyranose [Elusimicrobia bacterium ADurb.Bin231]|nr:MAG: dTDP-3-amino-3,4,6-trideoxy-alpha-D-glucopyranose [Elusimicrobia bacterium ADurb.Bin231]